LITDKVDKINKNFMKNIEKLSTIGFHTVNILLIIFYLFPGSILGFYLYDNISRQPQITRDFIISSNHLYIFIILSVLGIFSYQNKKIFKFVIIYLFLLSIILELLHIIIPSRGFEWSDLLGNIVGVMFGIVIYKVKNKYV
jgi:VanZ family protein